MVRDGSGTGESDLLISTRTGQLVWRGTWPDLGDVRTLAGDLRHALGDGDGRRRPSPMKDHVPSAGIAAAVRLGSAHPPVTA
jgi:hypothetical protein